MDKKYQVFISSTYMDLKDERQEVLQALLELDCIPVGMELFPAADEDQWTLIRRLIDDCDYYILIVGGRYGSLSAQGISYTEMEYEYAFQNGIPIISFLHKNPGDISFDKSEQDPKSREKLEAFKKIVQNKLVKFWGTAAELGSLVSRSLVKLIKDRPRPGWTRADKQSSEEATREILQLKNTIEGLEIELNRTRTQGPKGAEFLQQGDDSLEVSYRYSVHEYGWREYTEKTSITWSKLFYLLAPLMIDEATEADLKGPLNEYIYLTEFVNKQKKFAGNLRKPEISDMDFQTIKIQFRALGLIDKSDKKRSIKNNETYWTLTPYGDTMMVRLRALRKDSVVEKSQIKDIVVDDSKPPF